jgi:hypothetical protein
VISGLLIFLAAVGVARKVRSRRHGWSDAHIAIVVRPGGYDRLVSDVQNALASADLAVTAGDAPRVLTLPARILTRVAGSNVRNLRPDRLIALTAADLNVGIYPWDIAISGPTPVRTRARAPLESRLATESAYLTTSKEAQEVEDRLGRLARAHAAAGRAARAPARAELEAIDSRLLDLAVPTDEWDILYRIRLQIERDLLIGAKPGTASPGSEPNPGDDTATQRSSPHAPAAVAKRDRPARADPVRRRRVA